MWAYATIGISAAASLGDNMSMFSLHLVLLPQRGKEIIYAVVNAQGCGVSFTRRLSPIHQ